MATLLLDKNADTTDVRRLETSHTAPFDRWIACPYHTDPDGDLYLTAQGGFVCLSCHVRGVYTLLEDSP